MFLCSHPGRGVMIKFLNFFTRTKVTQDDRQVINSHLLDEYIAKAIKFIKVKQFHSGFLEISSPEQGGEIEVNIKQNASNPHLFCVTFSFTTMPDRKILLRQERTININELKKYASLYDADQFHIDEELAQREQFLNQQIAQLKN